MLPIQADLILFSLPQKQVTAFRTGERAYGPVLEVERMAEKRQLALGLCGCRLDT